MANVGQAALDIVGAAIGFAIGGPTGALYGFQLGSIAGQVAFPTQLPTQRGPRLDDLKAQSSTVGAPVPLVAGTFGVAGNVIWAADLLETKHKDSVGGKGGGGSQKVVSYSYSQSFAVGLAESDASTGNVFKIQGIRRIWANGKIIYDRTPQRDDEDDEAFTRRLAASDLLDTIMQFYDGSQTAADPTIESYEDVGNVPAYEDLSYVVFTDMQLIDYGNRAPQLFFEIYTNGSTTTGTGVFSNEVLYPWRDGATYFDSRDARNDHTYTISGQPYIDNFATAASTYCGLRTETYAFSSVGVGGSTIFSGSPNLPDYSGDPVIAYAYLNLPGIPTSQRYFNTSAPSGDNGNVPWWASQIDPDGGHSSPYYSAIFQIYGALGSTVWTPVPRSSGGLAAPPNTTFSYWVDAELWMKRLPTAPPNPVDVTGAIPIPGSTAVLIGGVIFRNQTWVYDTTGTYKVLAPYAQSDTIDINAAVSQYPLNPCLRDDDPRYSDEDYWTAAYDAAVASGDMAPGLDYGVEYPTVQNWAYVNSEGSGTIEVFPVDVGDIVAALCERCGINASHYDTSDLGMEVDGYAVPTVMSGRNAITPLTVYGMFGGVESGVEIKFVERGAAAVATISTDDLGATDADGTSPAVTVTRAQDVELPQVLRVHYVSPDRDYQPGEQQAARLVITSQNAVDLDIPVNMTDTKAAQLAEVYLFDSWMARNSYEFVLPYTKLAYDPLDCLDLPVDGITERVRITSTDALVPGVIKFSAVRDDVETLTSYAERTNQGQQAPSPGEIPLPGPTEIVLLDIPGLRSQDNDAGYYAAGRGYLPTWSGYTVMRSFNGGTEYFNVATSTDEATIGTLTAEFNGSSVWLTCTAESGSFADASDEDLDAGANLLAVGYMDNSDSSGYAGSWELIQFGTASLSGGEWTLTDLRRGLKGTSAFDSSKPEGSRVVLMTGGGIIRCPLPASQVNIQHLIKPVSLGNSVADTESIPFTSHGISLQGGGLGYDDDDNVIVDPPPTSGAIVVVSATTCSPPSVDPFSDSDLFGHWVQHQVGNDDAADFTAAFAAAPSAKAAMMRVYWSEVEPTALAYDFTIPLARLATCAGLGKQFAIMFMDGSYANDYSGGASMLPSDLAGDTRYSRQTYVDSYVAIRWNSVVANRLRQLWDAWISAVNSSGNAAFFAGIATQESSIGLTEADRAATGYTAQKYAQYFINNANHLLSAMPTKKYLFFANHFPGGRSWIEYVIDACSPLGNFWAGGPDNWWSSGDGAKLREDLYPRFKAHKDDCPIFIGMSLPSYTQPQTVGGSAPPYSTMLAGSRYARDSIGARMILSMVGSTAGNDFDPDMADVIETTMPTFNGSTNYQPSGVWYVPPSCAAGDWADNGGELATPDGNGGWTYTTVPPGSSIYATDTGQTFYTPDGTNLDDSLNNPIWRQVFGP